MKAAAARRIERARNIAGQPLPLAAPALGRAQHRHRGDQRLGVGMQRRRIDRPLIRDLDDFAEIHHRHPIRDMLHHAQIMRDEQQGQPQLRLQILQQIDDLRLHRDVERRHRLVAHHQPWPQYQRPRDPHPLALAAGKLMRKPLRRPHRQPDQPQHLRHLPPRRRVGLRAMDQQRLHDDVFHRHARIERAVGVLENNLHPRPHRAQRPRVEPGDLLAVEMDGPAGRLDQADQQPPQRRLPAAGFPHQPQGLAGADAEIHPVHRPQRHAAAPQERAGPDREMLRQPRGHQQRAHATPTRIQAASCPGPWFSNGGMAATQASIRRPQRGANRHPAGRRAGSGNDPGIAISRSRS